jgi:signal transduction histidine kinase
MHRGLRVLLGLGLVLAALAVAGWLDYRASSRELRALRRSEAATLYETIAAAAKVQHAAAQAAEAALGQRLLDHARLLAATDRRRALDSDLLSSIVADAGLFRVIVLAADGRREFMAGEPGEGRGPGRGMGGPAGGSGRAGYGGPPGAARIAQRLLSGELSEIVAEPHVGRAGGERIAAGVRRANGGAIVVNASNRLASELDSVYSLDALLSQISAATPALAYVVLQDQAGFVARGPLPPPPGDLPDPGGNLEERRTGDVPVFERHGSVALDGAGETHLRIAMRLDDVARAERRALLRVAGEFGTLGAVFVLAVALGGLRQRYGALSERHAHAQEALRRRDRLAAMGEMASTVAHEIRNPLNAIAMSAQRLAREYPKGDGEAPELVGVIRSEASRIDGRVQQFLEFARPRPVNLREIDIGELLNEVAAALAPLAGSRAVALEVTSSQPLVMRADSDQLRQALENLVRNAIDATPPEGDIALSAQRRGRIIAIEVRDTGSGIPADILPHIFDLYFTTKRDGTGVGLALVQQIAMAHGGVVSVDSEPGRGTRISLEIPQHGVEHG